MADVAIVDGGVSTEWTRLWGGLLLMVCGLALIPALALAWFGLLWLPGLDGLGWLGAAFLVAGPLLLGIGAVCGWRAVRGEDRRSLLRGAFFTLLAIPVYTVAWAWGGRMLL